MNQHLGRVAVTVAGVVALCAAAAAPAAGNNRPAMSGFARLSDRVDVSVDTLEPFTVNLMLAVTDPDPTSGTSHDLRWISRRQARMFAARLLRLQTGE